MSTCNLFSQPRLSYSASMSASLDSLRADTVFGWRQLRKHKVTSMAAILSLALAIGACTSTFRLLDALLWRPMPISHPERLLAVVFAGPSALDGAVMELSLIHISEPTRQAEISYAV